MPEEKQYVLPMPRRRGVVFFLLANVFAFALCASIWALVWYGEAFTGAASVIWGFLAAHSGWTVGAALSPLFAALVLGSAAGPAAAADQKVLKIGMLGVMRGPAASWGLVNKYSAETTAQMYNEQGGVDIGGEKPRQHSVARSRL